VLVSMYWASLGIKWHRREPNNSPVSSDEVMHNTKLPSVLGFQLNEQQ